MSVLLENESTLIPRGASATPTAFASDAKTGPSTILAPSSAARIAIACAWAGEPAVL